LSSAAVRLLVALAVVVPATAALVLAGLAGSDGDGGRPAAGARDGARLTWAPPRLDPPVRRVSVPEEGGTWGPFGPSTDCLVQFPLIPVEARVTVRGCHDVVAIGGEIAIGGAVREGSTDGVGLHVEDWTGVAHLEGIRLRGSGLSDGLWISSRYAGSVAQVESVRVDEVHGAYSEPLRSCLDVPAPHPDLIQQWRGPETVRIDRFTGYTSYQGLYPNSGGTRTSRRLTRTYDIRNGNVELIDGMCGIASLFDRATLAAGSPTRIRNFWGQPNGRGPAAFHPYRERQPADPDGLVDRSWWGDVRIGDPPGGDFVPPDAAGRGYESPGYRRAPSG
jgi:hypothetical protein